VEARHDRPRVAALDRGGLRVHGDVERAVAGAEHDEGEAEQRQRRGERRQPERHGERDGAGARDRAAAVPGDEPAGERHGHERAGGHAEQGDAERRLGEAELVAHRRDADHPVADAGAVEEEHGRHGQPRGARRPGRRGGRRRGVHDASRGGRGARGGGDPAACGRPPTRGPRAAPRAVAAGAGWGRAVPRSRTAAVRFGLRVVFMRVSLPDRGAVPSGTRD
jgi:hypothetical protein